MLTVLVASLVVSVTIADVQRDKSLLSNVNGKHFILTAPNFPPNIAIHYNASGSITGYSGNIYNQLVWLAQKLNFTYDIIPAKENTNGIKVNGTWTGLIGQIVRGEVDFVVGPFAISYVRYEAMDFVSYISGDDVSMLVKTPHANTSPLAVLKPFTITSWIGWLVSITVVSITGYVVIELRRKYHPQQNNWKPWNLFLYFVANMTSQGEAYRSGHHLVGFLATVWCLATFVFVNSYNGTLASYLSVSYNVPEVNSIEELASSSSNQLVILKGSISEVNILNSESGPFKILANKLLACPRCRSTSFAEIAQMVKLENFAGILSTSSATGIVMDELKRTGQCPLTLANVKYGWMPMYFAFPKNSPYRDEIDRESLWIDAFGFHTKWRKDLEVKSWKCLLKYNKKGVAIESANSRLSLRQLFAAFIILIIGYLIAFVAFILERFFLANEVIDV